MVSLRYHRRVSADCVARPCQRGRPGPLLRGGRDEGELEEGGPDFEPEEVGREDGVREEGGRAEGAREEGGDDEEGRGGCGGVRDASSRKAARRDGGSGLGAGGSAPSCNSQSNFHSAGRSFDSRRAIACSGSRKVSSSFHGAFRITMPEPFRRSGESSGCTINSARSTRFAPQRDSQRRNGCTWLRSLIGYQIA